MTSIIRVDQIEPITQVMTSIKIGGQTNYVIPSFIGQLTSFRIRRTTSQGFPFWNLSLPDQTLFSANFPDYTDYLRSIKVEVPTATLIGTSVSSSNLTITTPSINLPAGTIIYFHSANQFRTIVSNNTSTSHTIDDSLTTSAQRCSIINPASYESVFSGTWSGLTITLDDTAQNRILLNALSEDAYYQGGVIASSVITPVNSSNWIVVKWGTNEAMIASFNPSALTITLPSGSGTPSGSIELYPHRIINSLDARHKQVDDSVLINNGMQIVNGLRLRDREQSHQHSLSYNALSWLGPGGGSNYAVDSGPGTFVGASIAVGSPTTDGVNGSPRVGQFTRPRGLGVYFYEYVGRVI